MKVHRVVLFASPVVILSLLIIGFIGFLFLAMDPFERQDIKLTALNSQTEQFLDTKRVGVGEICLPQVTQGKHTIEQRTTDGSHRWTVFVGDVGIRVIKPRGTGSPVQLSNCGPR